MTERHWTGEAVAAFDQALAQIEGFGTAELWLQRAQVAAQIASAEQARIGNLIAWKALRQAASTSTSTLPNAGDAIADEIEASLGILERPADPARRCPATHPQIAGGVRCALDAGHLGDRHVTGTGHWWEGAA